MRTRNFKIKVTFWIEHENAGKVPWIAPDRKAIQGVTFCDPRMQCITEIADVINANPLAGYSSTNDRKKINKKGFSLRYLMQLGISNPAPPFRHRRFA